MYLKHFQRKAVVKAAKALRYARHHKAEVLQAGLMMAIMVVPDVSFAQSVTDGSDVAGFSAISDPLERLSSFMTGKGAKIAATVGACAGIGAWTLNTDNQIVKNSLRLTAGTGALLTVPGVVSGVSGFLIP